MTQQQRLKTQVLVIGAGISGSTSALTLADAGYEDVIDYIARRGSVWRKNKKFTVLPTRNTKRI